MKSDKEEEIEALEPEDDIPLTDDESDESAPEDDEVEFVNGDGLDLETHLFNEDVLNDDELDHELGDDLVAALEGAGGRRLYERDV